VAACPSFFLSWQIVSVFWPKLSKQHLIDWLQIKSGQTGQDKETFASHKLDTAANYSGKLVEILGLWSWSKVNSTTMCFVAFQCWVEFRCVTLQKRHFYFPSLNLNGCPSLDVLFEAITIVQAVAIPLGQQFPFKLVQLCRLQLWKKEILSLHHGQHWLSSRRASAVFLTYARTIEFRKWGYPFLCATVGINICSFNSQTGFIHVELQSNF
jgi:hypothetical protein